MLTISENGHPKDIEFVGDPIVVTEGKGYIIVRDTLLLQNFRHCFCKHRNTLFHTMYTTEYNKEIEDKTHPTHPTVCLKSFES